MTANSGLPIVNPEDMSRVWHFAIQAMPDEDDIELALEYLEELAERSSRAVPRSVVKITGQKLNQKGLVKSIDKLLGKTILIEDAADMNERVINEFCKIIAIEKAEKKSMRKLFQSKYDKRGCLILRDKDFEVG